MSATVILLSAGLLGGVALAQDPTVAQAQKPDAVKKADDVATGGVFGTPVYTTGDVRYVAALPPDLVANPDGVNLGQDFVLSQRLRPGVELRTGSFVLRTQADVLSGQLVGDAWDIPGTEDERHREHVGVLDADDTFTMRRASVQGRLGPVQVEAGLVLSHWGLGLLANDGEHDPIGFGTSDFGDRVLRLRLTTAPFGKGDNKKPIYISLAGDRVVEDELALMSREQEAWQGIASVLYADKQGRKLGVYGVYRNQLEGDNVRKTEAGVADVYGELPVAIGEDRLIVAFEAVGISGFTSRGNTYNHFDGVKVRSAALVGQARYELGGEEGPLAGTLRAGWLSGDGDPEDGVSHDFTADRDFDVGMVMFDELGGAIDAGAYSQLTDSQYSYLPPDGADLVVNEGAVRRAAYVQPVVEVKPKPWLGLKAGAVFAWQTGPIMQPFETFQNGGVPANHLAETTSGHSLGTELDWAVSLGDTEATVGSLTARPQLLLQGGHLLASDSYGGSSTGTLNLFLASARLRW